MEPRRGWLSTLGRDLLAVFVAACTGLGLFLMLFFVADGIVEARTGAWEGFLLYPWGTGLLIVLTCISTGSAGFLCGILGSSRRTVAWIMLCVLAALFCFVLTKIGFPAALWIALVVPSLVFPWVGLRLACKADSSLVFGTRRSGARRRVPGIILVPVILLGAMGAGVMGAAPSTLDALESFAPWFAVAGVVAFAVALLRLDRAASNS